MKKLIAVVCTLFCLLFTTSAQLFPLLTQPVFDITVWLNAIDQLYATYDQIMNQVQALEAQYEQMLHFANEAKSWKFDEIQWDGDLDFRNEIGQATRSINRQLTNIRKVDQFFTTDTITLGGWSGTLSDLLTYQGYESFFLDNAHYLVDRMKAMMQPLVDGLSDEQKMAIWVKYGLSPTNYVYMQKKKEMANNALNKVVGWASEAFHTDKIERETQVINNIVSEALGENVTEKALGQQAILMQQQLIEQLQNLQKQFADFGAMLAWQITYEQQEKQMEQSVIDSFKEPKDNYPGSLFSAGINTN